MLRFWLVVAGIFFGISFLRAADHQVDPIVSHIRRTPVGSTALDSIGYSKHLHALEIEFHDGLIYRYLEVPASVYRALAEAESKARFYNREIRGKYHCLRVKRRRERGDGRGILNSD